MQTVARTNNPRRVFDSWLRHQLGEGKTSCAPSQWQTRPQPNQFKWSHLAEIKIQFPPSKPPPQPPMWTTSSFFTLQAQVRRRFVSFRWQDTLKEVLIRLCRRLHWSARCSPPSTITKCVCVMRWVVRVTQLLLPHRVVLPKWFQATCWTFKCFPPSKKPSQSYFPIFSLSVSPGILSYIIQTLKERGRHSAVTK